MLARSVEVLRGTTVQTRKGELGGDPRIGILLQKLETPIKALESNS